ncbi:MAG TPA: serine hydrolase domain-containing protein [Pyrinomonadaceae bacterium]|nr:serine hydrolase domain-containing protein [Pyrinomonadaceae bacterium]
MKKPLSLAVAAVLLCGVVCAPLPAGAQSSPSQPADPYAARLREFEEFVAAGMKRDRIPGMTVGFFKDDHTWVKGFGYADLENKTPAHAESAYRLASITKSMTGEAIVQLAERGKLDLDAEIQRYVPDYPVQQWPVTVRHLLTHTAGGQVGSGLGPEHVTPKEVVARISKYPIKYETGVRFDYQTSGYNLLGAAIENVSGKSFDAYLRENLFAPAGMKDTGMDDVVNLVPNRVRGYELVNGEIKNAPFLNVSSRFGGGGLTGTVPDLLRWARAAFAGKIVSAKWVEEMLKPFTSKSGRYTGLGDGDVYYTLGWLIEPLNGRVLLRAEGSQKGTEALVYYFPEKRLGLAVACNLQFAPTRRYARRLYELVTGESWEAKVFTREKSDAPVALALNSAFNYGALDFERHRRPATSDAKELAAAFDFFNKSVSRGAVRADFAAASKLIRDARHPAGNVNLIKLGSYIASRLKERNGAAGLDRYHTSGAIPFFADYVRLYKSDPQTPKSLRFTPEFERLIARWDADWTRTWNDYTRRLAVAPDTDFDTVGARLRKEFAGAEVYPDFTGDIQPIQQGLAAFKAQKLGADLYPHSDELLFNWGYFIILGEMSPEGRAALKQVAGEYERPLAYFRRAHEANPDGVMRAGTFLDLGGRWLNRPPFYDAAVEFVGAGVALHPKDAKLRELLGDFLARKGNRELATEHYRAAYNLDAALAKGLSADDYVAQRLKAAGEKK